MNIILSKLIYWTLSIKVAFATEPGGGNPTGVPGGGSPTTGQTLPNPLGEGSTITTLLSSLLNNLILISVPIATIMILYGAFQILTSVGDPKEAEKGKKTIINTIIGFGIVLIASGIPYIIMEILGGSSTTQ